MSSLNRIFAPAAPNPVGSQGAQCFEGKVTRADERGVFVAIQGYDGGLAWGPCLPADASAMVGSLVVVAMSNVGRPWLLGAGGGGGEDPNIDGGRPDSVYGGDLPVVDGNGI